jgi:hypothetical protein
VLTTEESGKWEKYDKIRNSVFLSSVRTLYSNELWEVAIMETFLFANANIPAWEYCCLL